MLAIFLVASHAAGFAGAARNIVLEDALYWTPHPGHNPIHPGTYEHAVYAADLDGTNVRLVRNFTGHRLHDPLRTRREKTMDTVVRPSYITHDIAPPTE